ncbi:MAG: AAA family ATPase [Planctomycetes bacterium]|nr:AAA family ATPase [Planctomycetota bacterium]
MLKTLRLHNFKTFLNTEINFTQRHLIIGKNNSGKTNLCAALRFLSAIGTSDFATALRTLAGGVHEITNWASRSDTVELACECELPFGDDTLTYTYTVKLQISPSQRTPGKAHSELNVKEERLSVDGAYYKYKDVDLLKCDGRQVALLEESAPENATLTTSIGPLASQDASMLSKLYESETNPRAILFRRYLANWRYHALSPLAMRIGWKNYPATPQPFSGSGDNLANLLYALKTMDERRYRSIIDLVRLHVEPNLEAINFIPSPDQPPVPMIHHRLKPQASWTGLSDGTLRFLALCLVIENATQSGEVPALSVIEEPENGIYPGLLRTLFDMFEDRAPMAQFLMTSHSPYFVNLFDGSRDSVTLLRREEERSTIVPIPPADVDDPDRELLAEQYSMELFG